MNVTPEEICAILEGVGTAADIAKIEGAASLRGAGVDSLDMMNILLAIEEKYSIKIPDGDAEKLDSIESIVSYMKSL